MLSSARRTIRSAHLPFELLSPTCTKPSLHRFFTVVAGYLRKPPLASGRNDHSARGSTRARSREGPPSKGKSSTNSKYKRSSPTRTAKHAIAPGERPKRLLEPHILSQRLKKFCEGGQLNVAIDTLKNAPLDAQSTPVWNTLIWEVLKVQRWNLAYKLYTDVSQASFVIQDIIFYDIL
jgi:hypothetical protein